MRTTPFDPHVTPPPTEVLSDTRSGEYLVRLLEASIEVQRRHQFFTWASNQLHVLAPHRVLVCGHYDRGQRALHFDCFYGVPLSTDSVQVLGDAGGALLRAACAAWVEGFGNPLAVELARFSGEAGEEAERLARETDCPLLLIHGQSRPQRIDEVEGLYVLVCRDQVGVALQLRLLRMIVPTLHAVWRRVQLNHAVVTARAQEAEPARRPAARANRVITEREAEILDWVRQGMSNQQIAERLHISPLTVKNHMQKLLRKLGAGNRAQAVAMAIAQNLLPQRRGAEPAQDHPPIRGAS
jgi:transcriptional regulator EpsA